MDVLKLIFLLFVDDFICFVVVLKRVYSQGNEINRYEKIGRLTLAYFELSGPTSWDLNFATRSLGKMNHSRRNWPFSSSFSLFQLHLF